MEHRNSDTAGDEAVAGDAEVHDSNTAEWLVLHLAASSCKRRVDPAGLVAEQDGVADADQLHDDRLGGATIEPDGVEGKLNDSPQRMNNDRQGREQVELFAAASSMGFRWVHLCSLCIGVLALRRVENQISSSRANSSRLTTQENHGILHVQDAMAPHSDLR